jgi:hypothetical protein
LYRICIDVYYFPKYGFYEKYASFFSVKIAIIERKEAKRYGKIAEKIENAKKHLQKDVRCGIMLSVKII